MARYFLEVCYKGTRYSGFQVQENAGTIQSEIEKVMATLRHPVVLTGSSRTDAGVHALQNFFHFDYDHDLHPQLVYKLNAILPPDISVLRLYRMHAEAHARFDAVARAYEYHIHQYKDPFRNDLSWFFPFAVDLVRMQEAAFIIKEQHQFFAFSKSNSQVKNYHCTITRSEWVKEGKQMMYCIEGNRFLRGMVRLLTGAMVKVGRGKLSPEDFAQWFAVTDRRMGYAAPAVGLVLRRVRFPDGYFARGGGLLTSL